MDQTSSQPREGSTDSGDQIAKSVDFWSEWPQWDDDHTFRTPNLTFVSCHKRDEQPFFRGRIPVLKPRFLLDYYPNILRGRDTRAIAEIGYLHGGMVLFLADMMPRAKVIGIDRNQPPAAIVKILAKHNLTDRVHFYVGVYQENRNLVRSILDKELGDDKPLDLIIDDASHFYEESKATFEACFGYLRPGGKYVIEDWGWAHWDQPEWQVESNGFDGKTPLTRVLFELMMLLASRPSIVARLDIVDRSLAVVTRGSQLAHRALLDIDSSYLTAGRRFVGFTRTFKTRNVKGKLKDAARLAGKWRREYHRVASGWASKVLSRYRRA
jgi:SAM-dependent methyltransferase